MFISNLFKYFPKPISTMLEEYLKKNEQNLYVSLEEIRLRTNKPIILKFNETEKIFDYIVQTEDILETLRVICENSIYSYQNQICNRIYNSKRWTSSRHQRKYYYGRK